MVSQQGNNSHKFSAVCCTVLKLMWPSQCVRSCRCNWFWPVVLMKFILVVCSMCEWLAWTVPVYLFLFSFIIVT